MPGGLCGCLQQFAALVDSIKVEDFLTPRDIIKSLMNSVQKCANVFGLCSYFDRLWTRQELLYGRSVRVARTASEEIGCASAEISTLARSRDLSTVANLANLTNLSTFADRVYTKYLLGGCSPVEAYTKVITANATFANNALSSLSPFRGPSAKEDQPDRPQTTL